MGISPCEFESRPGHAKKPKVILRFFCVYNGPLHRDGYAVAALASIQQKNGQPKLSVKVAGGGFESSLLDRINKIYLSYFQLYTNLAF